MPQKKNQHYIPKMHLRNFATDFQKKVVNVFHLKSKKLIPDVPIKGQGSESYFYGEDGILEEHLGQLENITAKILSKITEENKLPKRYSDDHFTLCVYVLLAQTRTKGNLDKMNQMTDSMFHTWIQRFPEIRDLSEKYRVRMEAPFDFFLGLTSRLSPIIMDLKFKILKNTSQTPFIMSDDPTILYNDFDNKKGRGIGSARGYASKGLQIFYPMSPTVTLMFYDEWAYKVGSVKLRTIKINESNFIDQMNLLQILNANEVLFTNNQVSENYIKDLERKSHDFDKFDNQFQRMFQTAKTNEVIIMNSRTNPKVNLGFSGYKLRDNAKAWKPDDRISYPRSTTHSEEFKRMKRKILTELQR